MNAWLRRACWSLSCLLVVGAAGNHCVAADDSRPNILIITADNLGYGDLQMYNRRSLIRTPHLDRLASEGARLTSFYTASPTCTVSRACLLTGRIPQRHGLLKQLSGVAGNYGPGLNQREVLIPQLLKQAPKPYATGCFGKWNIGFAEGSRPTERGFDEFIGHASGNLDYYRHNYRERHDLFRDAEELHMEGVYSSDIFSMAAAEFIGRQSRSANPWFCYVPFNAPHFPTKGNKRPGEANQWQAPDWAFDACQLSPSEADPHKRYRAVVYALDVAIGRILDAVDGAGQTSNTFVFFMSDNGAFRLNRTGLDVGVNDPLRSGGVTCWEGGLRVVALARWPGHIPADCVIDEPAWSPDILQACVALSGSTLPDGVQYDGLNPIPLLTEGTATSHKSFYFEYGKHAACRLGSWKIVRETPNSRWRLFDLSSDLSEKTDLADTRPERLKAVTAEFDRWRRSTMSETSGDKQESPN